MNQGNRGNKREEVDNPKSTVLGHFSCKWQKPNSKQPKQKQEFIDLHTGKNVNEQANLDPEIQMMWPGCPLSQGLAGLRPP